jgi:porphobilinogen deaminase
LKKINHNETELCAKAERSLLKTIGGDCETAIGGLAIIKDNKIILRAQLFSDKGDESFEYETTGNLNEAISIGKKVGEEVLLKAGDKFKKK